MTTFSRADTPAPAHPRMRLRRSAVGTSIESSAAIPRVIAAPPDWVDQRTSGLAPPNTCTLERSAPDVDDRVAIRKHPAHRERIVIDRDRAAAPPAASVPMRESMRRRLRNAHGVGSRRGDQAGCVRTIDPIPLRGSQPGNRCASNRAARSALGPTHFREAHRCATCRPARRLRGRTAARASRSRLASLQAQLRPSAGSSTSSGETASSGASRATIARMRAVPVATGLRRARSARAQSRGRCRAAAASSHPRLRAPRRLRSMTMRSESPGTAQTAPDQLGIARRRYNKQRQRSRARRRRTLPRSHREPRRRQRRRRRSHRA